MEIREITNYDERSPFNGYGIWIVLDEKDRKAHLLHPVYLTELFFREYDFVRSAGNTLWPSNNTRSNFNIDRFRKNFKERIDLFVKTGRSFSVQVVAKALSGLEGTSLTEALDYIGSLSVNEYGESVSKLSSKANREYAIRDDVDPSNYRGRQRALLSAFKEHGPATIYQITSAVDGKLKTKSDLSRVVTYFVNKLASEGVLEILT